jgi:hypothetical protein
LPRSVSQAIGLLLIDLRLGLSPLRCQIVGLKAYQEGAGHYFLTLFDGNLGDTAAYLRADLNLAGFDGSGVFLAMFPGRERAKTITIAAPARLERRRLRSRCRAASLHCLHRQSDPGICMVSTSHSSGTSSRISHSSMVPRKTQKSVSATRRVDDLSQIKFGERFRENVERFFACCEEESARELVRNGVEQQFLRLE